MGPILQFRLNVKGKTTLIWLHQFENFTGVWLKQVQRAVAFGKLNVYAYIKNSVYLLLFYSL